MRVVAFVLLLLGLASCIAMAREEATVSANEGLVKGGQRRLLDAYWSPKICNTTEGVAFDCSDQRDRQRFNVPVCCSPFWCLALNVTSCPSELAAYCCNAAGSSNADSA